MKYITTLFLLASIALFTGCAGASPEPLKTAKMRSQKSFVIAGNIGAGTDLDNTAIALYEAALHFKKNNMPYFILNARVNQLDKVITNFQDLVDYCYPSISGKSSLEDKCNLTYFDTDIVRFSFRGYFEPIPDRFTWSVEQVLNDPLLNKHRNAALASFTDKTITYETIKFKKVRKYLKK